MAMTADQYREQLKALLPPGRAFPRERGTNMEKLLDAMAQELARLDARAEQLTREANPQTTQELLGDWERVAGLPDPCTEAPVTLQGRMAALVSRLASVGGQSVAYFIELAAALGYEVRIDEFRPFRAGMSSAGEQLTNGDWVYAWRVRAPGDTIIRFRAGQSAAGEPLRDWGNDILECRIDGLKPAHTRVLFAYTDRLLNEDGGALLSEDGDWLLLEA